MQKLDFTPLIIIGPGRSGTNMLRDIITDIKGFETWDCDEVNPIWRYGNKDYKNDELTKDLLTIAIKNYIRKRFVKIYKDTNAQFVVEKTCANSLRLAFVKEVFPEAKFIIINRDGRDVVPSAMKRWNASFELKYTLKKLRYVPFRDLFYYIYKFGANRVKKTVKPNEALSFWGPIYKGIKEDTQELPLLELCANQWKACSESILSQKNEIPKENLLNFHYEEFVNNPVSQIKRLEGFLNIKIDNITDLVKGVTNKSVGNHKREITAQDQKLLDIRLGDTLIKLGYAVN